MADEIDWIGVSEKSYTYYIYEWPTDFSNKEPGNYIFCKLNKDNVCEPLYIGEAKDLSVRFDNHHRMDCIEREGVTHIHVHTSGGEQERLDEETDLRQNYDPVCNRQ